MGNLKAHYRLLLGLDQLCDVTSVDLDVGSKSVTIALEYVVTVVCARSVRRNVV